MAYSCASNHIQASLNRCGALYQLHSIKVERNPGSSERGGGFEKCCSNWGSIFPQIPGNGPIRCRVSASGRCKSTAYKKQLERRKPQLHQKVASGLAKPSSNFMGPRSVDSRQSPRKKNPLEARYVLRTAIFFLHFCLKLLPSSGEARY